MPDTTVFFIDLFLLLATAVLAGELMNRLGQTALIGQLAVGVVLGPTLLGPFLGLATLTPQLSAIQFLGTVFILFMAGLDVVPEQISRMGLPTALTGVAVFAVPFALLSVLSELLVHGPPLLPLFLGLTLSITALPVMGIMLRELGLLKTRVGNLLINTALVNELVAVTVFAVLLRLQNSASGSLVEVAIAALSVAVFLSAMLAVHMALRAIGASRAWTRARAKISAGLRMKEAGFAILMTGVIGASLFSQFMGLTFVVGAFYAGILVTRESAGPQAFRTISGIFDAITWGFFIPLFFAMAGAQMNLQLLASPWLLLVFAALTIAAIVTKVGTGYSIARLFGWPGTDALAIGHLVSSRGAVELAMAVILLSNGVFSPQLYTIVAGVGLVTTVVAPVAASRVWRTAPAGRSRVRPHDRAADRSISAWGGPLPRSFTVQLVGPEIFDPSGGAAVGPDGSEATGPDAPSEPARSAAGSRASVPARAIPPLPRTGASPGGSGEGRPPFDR